MTRENIKKLKKIINEVVEFPNGSMTFVNMLNITMVQLMDGMQYYSHVLVLNRRTYKGYKYH